MAESKLKQITIEAPMGGMMSDLWGVPPGPLKGTPNQFTLGYAVSLFRKEKIGQIAPAEIFNSGSITDSGVLFNSLPRAVAVDVLASPNDYYYLCGGLAGTGPRVVKASATATSASLDPAAPTGNYTTLPATGFWGEDIVFYSFSQSGTTNTYILYSYNTSTTGAVGAFQSGNFATPLSNDFFSTTYFAGAARPTLGVPHRFCEGPNKILYMTNGQYVTAYDGNTGSNGTYTPQALNCGAGWISMDICKYQNFIAILCVKNGTSYSSYTSKSEAKVLLWDGTNAGANATPNYAYDVQDYFATAVFNSDQALYCFSQGMNSTTKIKQLPIAYGVSKFQTVYENATASIGNPPDPRSLSLYNNNIVWWGTSPNNAGTLCAYVPGAGFHQPFLASDGTNTSSTNGLVSNFQSGNLFIGMKSGTTYKVAYLNGGGGYATNVSFRSGLIELPYRSTVKRINLYFSQFDSTSSMIVSFFKDFNSMSIGGANDLLNTTITTTTKPELANGLQCSIIREIPDVSSFYLNLYFNHSAVTNTGAIVRKVEIIYELVDKP